MGAWKLVVFGALLSAALIAAIGDQDSNGFARGDVADQATKSKQQIQQISPVFDPAVPSRKLDADNTGEIEPWGPFRKTDW
jgi:hypothetical protein